LDAVEAADMPDDQVEEDDGLSPDGKSRRNTVQFSRHHDINDDADADDGDSTSEAPSSDEQDEPDNDNDV